MATPLHVRVSLGALAYEMKNRFKKGAGTASSPCFAGIFTGTGDEAVPAPDVRLLNPPCMSRIHIFMRIDPVVVQGQ